MFYPNFRTFLMNVQMFNPKIEMIPPNLRIYIDATPHSKLRTY